MVRGEGIPDSAGLEECVSATHGKGCRDTWVGWRDINGTLRKLLLYFTHFRSVQPQQKGISLPPPLLARPPPLLYFYTLVFYLVLSSFLMAV